MVRVCVGLRFLFLPAVVCTDRFGSFSYLEIAHKEELNLRRFTIVFLRSVNDRKALVLKLGPFTATVHYQLN